MGCVIAELFLDGKAFLDLGQLLSLKQGGGIVGGDAPHPQLWPQQGAIPDPDIRALVQHMTQVDPGTNYVHSLFMLRASIVRIGGGEYLHCIFLLGVLCFYRELFSTCIGPLARVHSDEDYG